MDSTKILNRYIHELITSYGKFTGDTYQLSMASLHDDEQGELVALYLEANDYDPLECLVNGELSTLIFAMMKSDTPDTREDFSKAVKKEILKYYSESIQNIIDDCCNDYLHESFNAKGLYAKRSSTGDLYWSAY